MVTSLVLAAWIHAVALQEGAGRVDHAAYNAAEDARGAWQVRPVMVREVARLTGLEFDHQRMNDPVYARSFVRTYFVARLARGDSIREAVRRWNGSGRAAEQYAASVDRIVSSLLRRRKLTILVDAASGRR